jgi:transposase
MNLQIVARRQAHAFEVLPRRWVVERTFAWIILWAMTALMACRLAQPAHLSTLTQALGGGR